MGRSRSSGGQRTRTAAQFRVSNRAKYHVPAELWADAVVGLGLVRRRLRVSEGASRPVTGSKPLAKNSVHAYGKHIRGLRYYCCLVGDYDSLLVLPDDAPSDHCPSMSAKTLSNFVRFKRGVQGTPLVDASGVPVLDRRGQPVVCQGGWNGPGNVEQFEWAVTAVHAARDQRGNFEDACNACWDAFQAARQASACGRHVGQHDDSCDTCWATFSRSSQSFGCLHHVGQPRLWRRGNPVLSQVAVDTKQWVKRETQGYKAEGNFALLPDQLLEIRRQLVATGSLRDYSTWVSILLGVHLFLRADEIVDIALEDFLLEMTAKDDLDRVDQLVVQVCGKSERAKAEGSVNLVLYRLDSHPKLCPIRALFMLVSRTRIKSGLVFGTKQHLDAIDRGAASFELFPDGLSYDEFNAEFVRVCRPVVGDDTMHRYGPHSIRKTAYLFAIWGGGDLDHIRQAARHKTLKNAELYYRDSKALLARARRTNSHVLALTPKWEPIFLENLRNARRIALDSRCPPQSSSIPGLASTYVATQLRVDPASVSLMQLISLAERDIPETPAFQQLEQLLQTHVPQLAQTMSLVNQVVLQRLNNSEPQPAIQQPPAPPPVQAPMASSLSPPPPLPQPDPNDDNRGCARRGGNVDLPGGSQLVKLSTSSEKSVLLLSIEASMPDSKTDLTERARTFVNQVLTPVLSWTLRLVIAAVRRKVGGQLLTLPVFEGVRLCGAPTYLRSQLAMRSWRFCLHRPAK